MDPDVSCIVIKSDWFPRRVPVSGEVVRVAGQAGSYVVMRVDHGRRMVQLMERSGKHTLFEAPFASIRVFNRKLAQAIRRFLDAHEKAKEDSVEGSESRLHDDPVPDRS